MCDGAYCHCSPGSDYHGGGAGHPLVLFQGWVNNDARYSEQTDILPIKIAPVHFTDWTARQIQLNNGWEYTNMGKRDPADRYNRMLYSSASGTPVAFPRQLKGNQQQATGSPLPSTKQIQGHISSRAPSDSLGPGAGKLAPGVTLANRRFYG